MPSFLGPYDLLLVVVVSAQATLLAYLYQPKWKAFLLTLPIPFTCATLALGNRIDATNVLGMAVLLFFIHSVRILYSSLRVPIVLAIAAGAAGYCAIGWTVARVTPATGSAFWLACISILTLAAVVLMQHPHRDEPGHRTSLPVWIKLPIIVGVILFLVLVKQYLRGFMTMFPMVGVIAAYEARHSLWTMSRQIPVIMLTMVPLMIVSRLTCAKVGLPLSLALGWVAYLGVLIPLTRSMWARTETS
jgi:uncharacterized membrane protein YhdT